LLDFFEGGANFARESDTDFSSSEQSASHLSKVVLLKMLSLHSVSLIWENGHQLLESRGWNSSYNCNACANNTQISVEQVNSQHMSICYILEKCIL